LDTTVSASDTSAKYSLLEAFSVQNASRLDKSEFKESVKDNTSTGYDAWLVYVYVDKDVTITADKYIESNSWINNGITYSDTSTVKAINLALKTGWNTVFASEEERETLVGGTWDNPTAFNCDYTFTASLSNPASLKWALDW